MRTLAVFSLSLLTLSACSSSGSDSSGTTPSDDGGTTLADSTTAPTDSGTTPTDSASTDDGTVADADSGPPHASPPAAPATKPGDGTGSVTFAITKLYFGDTRRDGTVDKANAWKAYGYDLDGKISTASSTDLCKPSSGATAKNVYPDGDDGIDNAYGRFILPIELGIASDASKKVNDAILAGKHTTLIDIQKLGSGSDYAPLVAAPYDGADLGMAPKFDGTDQWPVTADSVSGDITMPKQSFAMSYLAGGTWVSGAFGDVRMTLPIIGIYVQVVIHHAVLTMKLDAAHQTATLGTIAGVLSTTQFTTALRDAAGFINPSLCSGPTIDSIVTQIQQASDIMQDGTQDPTKVCDGISIGLGFDAAVVKLGTVAAPVSSPPNPCK